MSSTDVWNKTTTNIYDQAGRSTSTTAPAPAGTTGITTLSYDNVGQLTQQTLDGSVIANATYSPYTDPLDPGHLTGVSYPSGTGNNGNGTTGTLSYAPTTGETWTRHRRHPPARSVAASSR